jgi:hypothetical protein
MHRHHAPVSFDTLESRRLFSVTIGFVAPDKLTFTGDAANDTVIINDNAAGVISGQITTPAGLVAFGPTPPIIKQIEVKTNAGDDYVRYTLTADPTVAHNVSVDLGVGNDVFKMDATADIDIAPNNYLRVNVLGDWGKDYIAAYQRGELDGRMEMLMDGGSDDDTLITDVRFDPGSTGSFIGREWGSDGDDRMDLLVRKANPADPTFISAFASGGNGIDTLTRTIWASNDATCEFVTVVP